MSPLANLLLAVLGLPVVIGTVAGVARALVNRADRAAVFSRVVGEIEVAEAEAAHRERVRRDRLAPAVHQALAAKRDADPAETAR